MPKFEFFGKEVRYKQVKKQGTSGMIYLPSDWVGEEVAIINGITNEVENLSRTLASAPTIVYSYYVLDLVHKGHLIQMTRAKSAAGPNGISVVGILTDEAVMEKKDRPILSFDERIELAQAIKFNDFVVSQDTYSPLPNLFRIKPNLVLESDSHNAEDIAKVEDYMKSIKGRVIVTPYYPGTSSSKIKAKVKNS